MDRKGIPYSARTFFTDQQNLHHAKANITISFLLLLIMDATASTASASSSTSSSSSVVVVDALFLPVLMHRLMLHRCMAYRLKDVIVTFSH